MDLFETSVQAANDELIESVFAGFEKAVNARDYNALNRLNAKVPACVAELRKRYSAYDEDQAIDLVGELNRLNDMVQRAISLAVEEKRSVQEKIHGANKTKAYTQI